MCCETADATYLPLRTVNGILRSYENNSQTGSIVLPWLGLSSEGAPLENVYLWIVSLVAKMMAKESASGDERWRKWRLLATKKKRHCFAFSLVDWNETQTFARAHLLSSKELVISSYARGGRRVIVDLDCIVSGMCVAVYLDRTKTRMSCSVFALLSLLGSGRRWRWLVSSSSGSGLVLRPVIPNHKWVVAEYCVQGLMRTNERSRWLWWAEIANKYSEEILNSLDRSAGKGRNVEESEVMEHK